MMADARPTPAKAEGKCFLSHSPLNHSADEDLSVGTPVGRDEWGTGSQGEHLESARETL